MDNVPGRAAAPWGRAVHGGAQSVVASHSMHAQHPGAGVHAACSNNGRLLSGLGHGGPVVLWPVPCEAKSGQIVAAHRAHPCVP